MREDDTPLTFIDCPIICPARRDDSVHLLPTDEGFSLSVVDFLLLLEQHDGRRDLLGLYFGSRSFELSPRGVRRLRDVRRGRRAFSVERLRRRLMLLLLRLLLLLVVSRILLPVVRLRGRRIKVWLLLLAVVLGGGRLVRRLL